MSHFDELMHALSREFRPIIVYDEPGMIVSMSSSMRSCVSSMRLVSFQYAHNEPLHALNRDPPQV